MPSIEDLKNFFEDTKKSFGLNIEVEEVSKGLKVTFHNVEYIDHEILSDDGAMEDYLEVAAGGSTYNVTISERGKIEVEAESSDLSDGKVERKEICMYPGVSIKSTSFEGNKFSVEFVEDNEEEDDDE